MTNSLLTDNYACSQMITAMTFSPKADALQKAVLTPEAEIVDGEIPKKTLAERLGVKEAPKTTKEIAEEADDGAEKPKTIPDVKETTPAVEQQRCSADRCNSLLPRGDLHKLCTAHSPCLMKPVSS